jgi:hypothetical protein
LRAWRLGRGTAHVPSRENNIDTGARNRLAVCGNRIGNRDTINVMRHPKYKRKFSVLAKRLHISKTELAERLGVSHTHFFCIARGARAIGAKPMAALQALEQLMNDAAGQ